MAIRFILILTVFGNFCCTGILQAQQAKRGFDWNFLAGVNIGATTPVLIPGDLKIRSYHPRLNPKAGADFTYYFDKN